MIKTSKYNLPETKKEYSYFLLCHQFPDVFSDILSTFKKPISYTNESDCLLIAKWLTTQNVVKFKCSLNSRESLLLTLGDTITVIRETHTKWYYILAAHAFEHAVGELVKR